LKTSYKTADGRALFIIVDLDPAYRPGAINLGFSPSDEGLIKSFPAESPDLERIYRNFQRYGEDMFAQRAQRQPVPWDRALSAFLSATAGHPINWWLVGSAALAVRGVEIAPQDLDLATDGAGAKRLGELLLEYLVEPVIDCRQDWISDWWGRAFLHARVEWVGDVHADVDRPDAADFGPVAASRLESVKWQGWEISVPPLDLQMQVSQRRGLDERVEKIKQYLARAERRP